MQVPIQRSEGHGGVVSADGMVYLSGDAYIVITAPFFPEGDPLASQAECVLIDGDDLDGEGALMKRDLPLSRIMRGTLTFQEPSVPALTSFVGGDSWLAHVRTGLEELGSGLSAEQTFEQIELSGMLFPDGYGSVAVTLRVPDGWGPSRRAAVLEAVGVNGRDALAEKLRSELLPPLQRMLRRSGIGDATVAALPYFNLTYAGSTDHPQPGRAVLDDELRALVYPDSPMPLWSSSPWMTEYLYTGYAYHLLATREPLPSVQKLALLLLVLNASYARLARFATAADNALQAQQHYRDVEWLARIERRLRAEYHFLVTPTFSFDHHALKVRDAILKSWDVAQLQARADNVISMVRGMVEFRMAQDHARRVRRLNVLVAVLTAVAVIPVVETAVAIFRYLTG